MVEAGLSAAVYTQTTDVEIEGNGLMTYDRAGQKGVAIVRRRDGHAAEPVRPLTIQKAFDQG